LQARREVWPEDRRGTRAPAVPVPQSGLRAVLGCSPVVGVDTRGNRRRDDGHADLRTRYTGHRPRRRWLDGNQEARRIFLKTIHEFLERNATKDLLRLSTVGSVDDGKSTLIGRLLHDTKSIYEDHLHALRADSARVGTGPALDFALLTDGLKAEREQKI